MTPIRIYIALTIFACTCAALATAIRGIRDHKLWITAAIEALLPAWGAWLLIAGAA